MNEAALAALEGQLERSRREREDEFEKQKRIERHLEALRSVAGMLSDPEEIAAFEEATRRHPLFRGRELGIEPDEEEQTVFEEAMYGS